MPYVLEYPADQSVVARATAAAYGASAAEEARRYQDQQGLADQEMQYRFDQQAIDASQRQQQIDDSAYQFNAGLGQQMLRQQQDNALGWAGANLQQQNIDQGWAQIDQSQANAEMNWQGQQARAQATLNSRNMQIVAAKEQERQRQNFERAMFLDEQIEKQAREGWFTSQAQYDQAKADVERQTGIPSGAIQREFMDRQANETQTKRQAAMQSYSSLTGLTPAELDAMVVDDGSGEFVLADPKFVESMATTKQNNKRMMDMHNSELAAAQKKSDQELEAKKAEAEIDRTKENRNIYQESRANYGKYLEAHRKYRAAYAKAEASDGSQGKIDAPSPLSFGLRVAQDPSETVGWPKGTIFVTPNGTVKTVP